MNGYVFAVAKTTALRISFRGTVFAKFGLAAKSDCARFLLTIIAFLLFRTPGRENPARYQEPSFCRTKRQN
jgi:hypothetical protein